MKLNDIPKLMPVPFGVNGPREELLETSPAGNRSASYADGFPPITMLLKQAGGLPPKGENMNQILFELANGQRWSNSGAGYKFNKAFSEAVGGYPKGAQLLSNDGTKVYVSTKDDNKTDFNTSPGADWVTLGNYIGLGDYAKAEDLKGYLAKDKNGEDIPNKDAFIKNLGLPEKFQPKGNYAVTNAAATQLFTGPVISSDTVGAQNADGKLKSFLFNSGGAAPAWGATANGRYAGALIHPLKDGTAATTDDVKEAKGLALGVGQAWQIVTRGNGATNTNNTGRTITVNVIRYTGVRGRVSVNGISVAAFRGGRTDTSPAINVDMTVTAIVPPGAKYIISWDKDVADAGEPEIVELR
ncbi:TPA: hypothetical protein I8W52_000311 [Morganella morganii]|nr:hypothetical protein [Morganella morganii]